MRIILVGAPGAGKGTHAKILSKRFRVAHIATGDLLRSHVQSGDALGKRAKAVMDRGELVPDDLVIQMIEERLAQADAKEGFILDGFPRTLEQARALDRLLETLQLKLDAALDFAVTEQMVIRRLSGRRVCLNCGMSFHVRNIPPKRDGICDTCGKALVQRKDDEPATILERLKVYQKNTAPLIEYYRSKKLLYQVDGDLEVEPLQQKLDDIFTSLALN